MPPLSQQITSIVYDKISIKPMDHSTFMKIIPLGLMEFDPVSVTNQFHFLYPRN